MKLQLDTTNKTIRLEESVVLGEFIAVIEIMLPNGAWKEFKVETNSVIQWTSPTIVHPFVPYNPWNQPWYNTNGTGRYDTYPCTLNNGTYCVEFKLQ